MRVMLTGATGFIGRVLTGRLTGQGGFEVRVAMRRNQEEHPLSVERIMVGELGPETDWTAALTAVDAVVHMSGRAHVLSDPARDSLPEFRRVNVAGSVNLARQAAAAGVCRFVFLSSVKVNGESGRFREHDPPAPCDAYGVSKLEAEVGLRRIAEESSLEVVVVRPPLVYGPNPKANFRRLVRAVARGIPLPLGAVHNIRSFVSADNLADFIVRCLTHPRAVNETFFVSDGEDLSTAELIRRLALAMDRPPRLVPVPVSVLSLLAAALGRGQEAKRLLGSLQVDTSKARQVLGWKAAVSVDEGLRRAVGSFK